MMGREGEVVGSKEVKGGGRRGKVKVVRHN